MIGSEDHAQDAALVLPRLLTLKEVANILRIHPRTAYRLVQDGALAAIRVGTQWRVTEEALHEYVSRGWRHWRPEPSRAKTRQYPLPLDDEE
ncbi:MAG: helix-turn-helix domain-containing protein [Humidesulfovibrio sp.]